MGGRVGVVAVSKTPYGLRPETHLVDLVLEAVQQILEATGLSFAEKGHGIDATVSCSQDHWDGWTISSKHAVDAAGGHLRPEEKVAGDGAYALCYAAISILSGHHEAVLVVAHTKESQVDGRLIENMGLDPLYLRILGLDFAALAALQARQYMDRFGLEAGIFAGVAAKNLRNGYFNPTVPKGAFVTEREVLASPMLVDPIHTLEAKPIADGACAMIVASEERVRGWTDKPVWITGMGYAYDRHYPGYKDLTDPLALKAAGRMAYEMAGIRQPAEAFDLVELSEYFSYQEPLWCEGLGLCPRGEGSGLFSSGITGMEGRLPVNPSGGLLSGVPVNVAGLDRAAEAALQLRGEAGQRQVPGARRALVHGTAGACGQMHCVLVLERGF